MVHWSSLVRVCEAEDIDDREESKEPHYYIIIWSITLLPWTVCPCYTINTFFYSSADPGPDKMLIRIRLMTNTDSNTIPDPCSFITLFDPILKW